LGNTGTVVIRNSDPTRKDSDHGKAFGPTFNPENSDAFKIESAKAFFDNLQ
jgi:hypothetical protein